jgi:hypothetical protein
MNDEHLNKMLQSWKPEANLPSSFQRDVWHRIEAAGAGKSPVAEWLTALLNWLAKPLPATATCVLTLGVGLVAGGMVGGAPADAKTAAYAYSIDPLAKRPAP